MKRLGRINKLYILLGFLTLAFALFVLSHKIVTVSGDSMSPTLRDGQIVIGSNVVAAERGNIYLFEEPDAGQYAIKRLIGIPGDKVELKDGATYVNGELYMEAPGDSWDNNSWALQADEYLFLGDHRGVSYDGRHWSRPVHFSEIVCKLDTVVYPFSFWGEVQQWESVSKSLSE